MNLSLRHLCRVGSICLFLISIFSTSFGQWQQISQGLYGGTVLSLGAAGNSVFAGTLSAGIYRSTDAGATWAPVHTGFHSSSRVTAIVTRNEKIYAGDFNKGVLLSTNNGDSWTAINVGLANPQVNNLSFVGNDLYASTVSGCYVLRDGATQWAAVGTFAGQSIGAVGGIGTFVLLSNNLGKIYRSADNGATWTVMNGDVALTPMSSFASSGGTVYASGSNGVYYSVDNGSTWTKYTTIPPGSNFFQMLVDGTTLYVAYSGGVIKSIDNGVNWTEATGIESSSRCILKYGTKFLTGSNNAKGIAASTDGATTFSPSETGLTALTVNKLAYADNTLLAATDDGVYISSNMGTSWTLLTRGWFDVFPQAFDVLVDGTRIYTSFGNIGSLFSDNAYLAKTGISGANPTYFHKKGTTIFGYGSTGAFKFTPGTNAWTASSTGLPVNNVISFTSIGETAYAGVFAKGVQSSIDNGATWTPIDATSTQSFFSMVSKGDTILAAGSGVWMSPNKGTSFQQIATFGVNVNSVFSGDNLYFAGLWEGIQFSNDNGRNWSKYAPGLSAIAGVKAYVIAGNKMVIGTTEGVWTTPLSTFYPSITGLSKVSSSVGSTVEITGVNFSPTASANAVAFNGAAAEVTSATSTKLVVKVPGEATTGRVTVTVNHHKATSAEDFEVVILGIDEYASTHLNLYPNPAANSITLDLGDFNESLPVEIEIVNALGKPMLHRSAEPSNAQSIDVSNYSSGLYILRLQQRSEKRVVKFWKK